MADVVCPRCDGQGRVVVERYGDGLVRAAPAYPPTPESLSYPCALCKGAGRVPAPVLPAKGG